MRTEFDHEKTPEYRAAYELQQYVTQNIQSRRGLGAIRAQLDRQLVRALTSIAEALARPKHPDFLRLLDNADASCVRIATLLHLLSERGVATADELDHARVLVQRLRDLLDRHFNPDSGEAASSEETLGAAAAAPANDTFVAEDGVRFGRPRKRSNARPVRRARLQ